MPTKWCKFGPHPNFEMAVLAAPSLLNGRLRNENEESIVHQQNVKLLYLAYSVPT